MNWQPVAFGILLGLALLAGVVLAATARARHRKREAKRGALLQAWGQANGWTYQEAPLTPKNKPHAPHTRLRMGADRLLETMVDGMPATVAESSHVQTSRTNNAEGGTTTTRKTLYVTMYALRLPGGPWPELSVGPRPGALRLAGSMMNLPRAGFQFGYRDFDDRFMMQSKDPNAPRVFTQQLLDAHLAGHLNEWWLREGQLVVSHHGRLDPEGIPDGVGRVRFLASLLARPVG